MSIFLLAAAAAAAASPTPAAPTARGYEARMTATGLVCLRPTNHVQGVRLDIPVRREECRSQTRWESQGLRVSVNGART